MRRAALLAGLLLTACMREEPVPELVSYRDQNVPIASQVDVVASDLQGSWNVRQAVGWTRPGWLIEFEPVSEYLGVRDDLPGFMGVTSSPICTGEGVDQFCDAISIGSDFGEVGPGRFLSVPWDFPDESSTLWILWADADRRTLAVGNPEGTFGFILDREPTGGEDRIAAARDIMEWMGYRVDEMVSP